MWNSSKRIPARYEPFCNVRRAEYDSALLESHVMLREGYCNVWDTYNVKEANIKIPYGVDHIQLKQQWEDWASSEPHVMHKQEEKISQKKARFIKVWTTHNKRPETKEFSSCGPHTMLTLV